jgi:glycosyltransferase involved in cell wall biosynthesis
MTSTSTSGKRVLVILPTLNEAKNLPLLVPKLLAHDGFRLLVVDDRSTDGTGTAADELARLFPGRIEVVHRTGARGLGLSYAEAFPKAAAFADVDVICQMDADLSHDHSIYRKWSMQLSGTMWLSDLVILTSLGWSTGLAIEPRSALALICMCVC